MAISDQTLESLRSLGRQAERRGRHAVIEPDLLLALLDEVPTREKYARALASASILSAKLQRIRRTRAGLAPWRRVALRWISPQLHDELRTIATPGR